MTRSERLAWFIGETARPFAIVWSALCGGIAFVIAALRVTDGNDGAVLVGAIGLIVTGLFGFKAVEVWKGKQSDASVEVAKAEAKK